MINDYDNVAITNLRHRKLRSWLTIMGIVISVMSIVALISISNGLENSIKEQFEKIGSNRIFVLVPGGQPGTSSGLTTKDVETLEKMPEFDYVTPYLMEPSVKVEHSKEILYSRITAWPAKDSDKRFADYDFQFLEGRSFSDKEKNVAVIGYLTATDFFKKDMHAGNKILINEEKFDVVGVLDEVGNEEDDRQILIPLEAARITFAKEDDVSIIEATIKPGKSIDDAVEKTKRNLKKARNDENFDVLTPTQILNFLKTALGLVQGILVGIAAISLIVGCIGIMNSMYTSVIERTKEIGIMKSLGARNNDIMFLFLIESGLIGLIGGIIGVILGMGISFAVGIGASQAGFGLLSISWDWGLAAGALLFAFFIGMISGALPSRQAAKLHPVDALRWTG
ncbi:MAG: ABC transporter permease [Candidatus Woesearchaeota archaeon]|nr:ABC transporter permease [Candidatus Woesearchaeota archaeon]